MKISDLNASTLRPDQLKNANAGHPAAAHTERSRADEAKSDAPADRVEISDKARAALADGRRSEELTFARKALHSVPEMSEERMAMLKERIATGFYNHPEVLDQIATSAAGDLLGRE